ncbi:MAG: FAD-dependent oxidoreductase [Candidatus Stahlbacteria bacterium]|nr:MAG: FAD-dependent oxidoreductase [Candidatus Stahlbacteria bacterium]
MNSSTKNQDPRSQKNIQNFSSSKFPNFDICIIGGGPAGLEAGIVAKELDANVIIIDDNPVLGGQLIKQTHKFFGSKAHYCGVRGIDIAKILTDMVDELKIDVLNNATVVGYYDDDTLGVLKEDKLFPIKAKIYIFAAGASENMLVFENSDLPGVYGAGAVQTMMNVYGVVPGKRALVIGSGNIGLIVPYQLLQAGVEVAAIIEILDKIGGYYVHAAKIKRAGVPIYLRHTIIQAKGKDCVEAAVITQVGDKFENLKGTEKTIECDMILIAIGLSPLCELLYQAGCRIDYVPELGGNVPYHNENMMTSKSHIFVCGDLACIEEASTAMLEGKIAGAKAYETLYKENKKSNEIIVQANKELSNIRSSPFEQRILSGKEKMR